jgi:hypothetical protein
LATRVLLLLILTSALACARAEPDAPQIEAAPPAEAAERKPLAEVTNQAPAIGVQVLEVKRVTADTVRVDLAVTNRTAATAQPPDQLAVEQALAAFAGLSLVSRDGRRRFFPLHDMAGKMSWSGLEAPGPGQKRPFWAVFPVPESEPPFVTIVLPGLKPIKDVPVS